MSVNVPTKTFGQKFGAAMEDFDHGAAKKKEDSQFWINIGYQREVVNAQTGETETIFVALPYGVALDPMKEFDLNTVTNPNMARLRRAQNHLLGQVNEAAATLAPGEDVLLACDENTGLAIQLRRVKAAAAVPADDDNSLIKPLKLVPKAPAAEAA